MRLKGKVALVTGGRSGIGRAVARRLAAEGARVLTAQRGVDAEAEGITADLADADAPARVVAEAVARAGRLDVLVICAGIMEEAGIEAMDLDRWERTLRVNLTGPFLLIRAALPHLRDRRGAIVSIGSIEGMAANPSPTRSGSARASPASTPSGAPAIPRRWQPWSPGSPPPRRPSSPGRSGRWTEGGWRS